MTRNVELDAERYNWLRNGGWEVLQDPKYWRPELKFDGAVDAARIDAALTGISTEPPHDR